MTQDEERKKMADALETIADGNQSPGHVAYMTKAQMAALAARVLREIHYSYST